MMNSWMNLFIEYSLFISSKLNKCVPCNTKNIKSVNLEYGL